jgi:hypothetical protein
MVLDASDGRLDHFLEDKEVSGPLWSTTMSPRAQLGVYFTTGQFRNSYIQTVSGDGLVSPLTSPPRSTPIVLRSIAATGRLGVEVTLPKEYVLPGSTAWSQDGKEFLMEMRRVPEQRGQLIPVVIHFDPATNEYYETTGAMPSYEEPERKSSIAIEPRLSEVTSGVEKKPVMSWWLSSKEESEDKTALIAAHADRALLSPNEKVLAYTVEGAMFVRHIIEIPVEMYREMKLAAQKAVLISNGKQIGLALQMFAADNDDTIPPGFDPQTDLMPYLKNAELFKGFVLVFPGGELSKLENPAETVMGYIEGPGGRAVVYMDSHVKWIPTGGG